MRLAPVPPEITSVPPSPSWSTPPRHRRSTCGPTRSRHHWQRGENCEFLSNNLAVSKLAPSWLLPVPWHGYAPGLPRVCTGNATGVARDVYRIATGMLQKLQHVLQFFPGYKLCHALPHSSYKAAACGSLPQLRNTATSATRRHRLRSGYPTLRLPMLQQPSHLCSHPATTESAHAPVASCNLPPLRLQSAPLNIMSCKSEARGV